MADKIPLIIQSGQIRQMQSGDTVPNLNLPASPSFAAVLIAEDGFITFGSAGDINNAGGIMSVTGTIDFLSTVRLGGVDILSLLGGDAFYSPGSFTVATETAKIMSRHLKLTGSQRATLAGTATLRIT